MDCIKNYLIYTIFIVILMFVGILGIFYTGQHNCIKLCVKQISEESTEVVIRFI